MTCTTSQRSTDLGVGEGAFNFSLALYFWRENLPREMVLFLVFRHSKLTKCQRLVIMSRCLEKGEGRSWKPTSTQSKALFLKCWRLRYFLFKHGRLCELSHYSNEVRPDVGLFKKLQHKGQLLFMYLAWVESFVNSQESVPLSFTGKTTQLLLKRKNNSCVRATHFPTLLNQMNPTY